MTRGQPTPALYAVLPTGSFHGWGVCGKYLVKELSHFARVKLVTEGLAMPNIQDEFDFRMLQAAEVSREEHDAIARGDITTVAMPVLHHIVDKSFRPSLPNFRGTTTLGYTFFEDNVLPPQFIENGRRNFDSIITGSTWCEEVLRGYGLTKVKTIIQGIDPTIFHPHNAIKEYLLDAFVVFSGGKFELRKGQDIVLRAFKVLHDRHKDVMLVNSWFNHWPASMRTMAASPHIRFAPVSGEYHEIITRTLHENGIDSSRVMTLPPYPNIMMPRIYRNTDVGLFPNRCEGGTNLVMMEYMACGKPVIASYSSGHRDVLTDGNSLRVMKSKQITITDNGTPTATWDDPDIDEVIELLEWSYQHRDAIAGIGRTAGNDLAELTWARCARQFYLSLCD